MLSVYSLPDIKEQRLEIYKLLFKHKKEFHFVFEEKSLTDKKGIEFVEDLFIFNCSFFTNKKNVLSKFERQFLKEDWSFV